MNFQPINMDEWARAPYFDYYVNRIKCRYTLNANVDISALLPLLKKKGLRFYPAILYAATKIINQNPQFRMAYDREGRLGYWDELSPSYTIFHSDDCSFSDIWTQWSDDFSIFYQDVVSDLERYRNIKGIKAKPCQPANTYPISSAPWLSFTGYNIDTYEDSSLLAPILTFGKYFTVQESGTLYEEKVLIPLAVFVHHAVADGYHSCKLINEIQALVSNPEEWIK